MRAAFTCPGGGHARLLFLCVFLTITETLTLCDSREGSVMNPSASFKAFQLSAPFLLPHHIAVQSVPDYDLIVDCAS